MNSFDTIQASLPNGFHDAELQKVVIDYFSMEAHLTLDIWIGDMSDPGSRESYRLANLSLSGLIFWIVEAPQAGYPYDATGGVSIDSGSLDDIDDLRKAQLPPVPEDAFCNYFYINDWNSLIFFAAKNASLTWIGDITVRH